MFKSKRHYILWQNKDFIVTAPKAPHISLREGCHLGVFAKKPLASAWQDCRLAGKAFALASKVAGIIIDIDLVQWANIQFNGNWGLLPGKNPYFHLHIYGRKKLSPHWATPVPLPRLPKTFNFPPLPLAEIKLLKKEFASKL